MKKFTKCITNQNDVYVYFEIMNQIKPERVLDVGMFLKRIGAISRQVMDTEIEKNVYLCGVDFMEECKTGVYSTVYNEVIGVSEFVDFVNPQKENTLGKCEAKYDIAYMLRVEDVLTREQELRVWKWLERNAMYAVVDAKTLIRNLDFVTKYGCKKFTLDQDNYAIIIF